MDCNKDEAMRAKEIAEKKMQSSDFEAARKIVLKARNLYPELENITQMMSICDVYRSAQSRLPGIDKDWYGVLQVEKLADESTIKKQYRRLALILHPDKNRFPGAEGAFKLICEANALLSDPAKKSVYDNKIKVFANTNQKNQPNSQYGAQNISSNGFSSQNQSRDPQVSTLFWTSCPYCKTNFQYPGQFVKKFLLCSRCKRGFTAYATSAPSGIATKLSRQGASSKPNVHPPDVFQAAVATNQANPEISVKNVRVPPTSHAGSQGTANMKTVKSQPGARKRGENLKTKETVNLNASSPNAEKVGVTSNGDPVHLESRKARNKSKNRGRKGVPESSDDSGTDIENVTEQVNLGDAAATNKSESARAQFSHRSSRRRQQVSYNETDEVDNARPLKRVHTTKEAVGKERGDFVHGKGSVHENQNSFPTVPGSPKSAKKETGPTESNESLKHKKDECDKEGGVSGVNGGRSSAPADAIEIDSDSDLDLSSSTCSDEHFLECPDPEFSDFDKLRHGSQFQVNQFWACYDEFDSMPRFYAKVKKVVSTSPLKLKITWLEVVPINDSWDEWVDNELPVGCGSFEIGKPDEISGSMKVSHQVHCEKGKKRGSLYIYPREGEVWALYKDWNISWSSNTENHKEFKFEIVEVLSSFADGIGIRVMYLNKVFGFVSLFQRAVQTNSFLIPPEELYRFSHCIPSFKLSGTEREGVPVGSFELDPASLPAKPDDLCFPCKANFGRRDKDPGVGSSVPKYADAKGKSLLSGSPCSPHKIVDLEGTRGNASSLRRSPRGVKIN